VTQLAASGSRLEEIDLLGPALFEKGDYHAALRVLRREDPVHWNPGNSVFDGFWSLTRYRDIRGISRRPDLFISSKGIAGAVARDQSLFPGPPPGAASIIMMDPPRHVKLRRLVNKGFTPRAVDKMESRIRTIANEILDGVAELGSFDFVVEVAAKLPLAVICGMLGLERSAWPLMFDLTNRMLGAGDPEYQDSVSDDERGTLLAQRDTAMKARFAMFEFFRGQIEQRRRAPGDDIVSGLIDSEVDGEKLSDFELLAFCLLLVLAGNETTRNAISGGMVAFAEHPAERARLQRDPALIETAVEEVLRWTSPLHHMARVATADVEIGGRKIRAGDRVLMWYPSANRDEEVFPDPFRFDVARDPNDHLAFGIGEHFCLGAGFARKEVRVMFEELFRRFPKIEVTGPPERLRSNFINGVKHLPVRIA
jgi:cholest-4-en-3-one 26-monooxygenase